MLTLPNGNSSQLPSLIKDPFLKDHVSSVSIFWFPRTGWFANIEFTNGNTSGKQTTQKYEDINDLFVEIRTILDQIKNKG